MNNKQDNFKNFEVTLKRLEEIVEKMEGGGLTLDESVKLYEEGIKKADMLNSMLSDVRNKVMKLVTDSEGNTKLEKFDREDSQ
jgi:exodeoxyribonuclease VII small subunit